MLIGNPVVDMLYMIASTDIKEWVYVESLGKVNEPYKIEKPLTDEEILRLKHFSPGLQSFDPTSKTKVLFIIGDSDLRVTPKATYSLFQKLRRLGLEVELNSYKGSNHSIPEPENSFDVAMNILWLFLGTEE